MPTATQTGIPITTCGTCHRKHPITRKHCAKCGWASAFIHVETDQCLRCHMDDE